MEREERYAMSGKYRLWCVLYLVLAVFYAVCSETRTNGTIQSFAVEGAVRRKAGNEHINNGGIYNIMSRYQATVSGGH
jgi:hypothetical protein